MKYPKIEANRLYDLTINNGNDQPFGSIEEEVTKGVLGIDGITVAEDAISVKKIPGATLIQEKVQLFLKSLADAGSTLDIKKVK